MGDLTGQLWWRSVCVCACVCKETNEDLRIMKKGNKKEKSKEEN